MNVRASSDQLDGLLAIDKPSGWTSHDVVAVVRRVTGQRRVGHGGTLDPLATGLLPLGLGKGARLLEHLAAGRKTYIAEARLGAATDTYDADGAVTLAQPWQHVGAADVERALAEHFSGAILQRPPAYSAIKRAGVPLYRLARRGVAVEAEPRPVTIHRISLTHFDPPELGLEVECSSGTYVRSLIHDLGLALGTAAHLTALRRTRHGALSLADAVSLEELRAGGREAALAALLALDRPVSHLPAVVVSAEHAAAIAQGKTLPARRPAPLCRAYSASGAFLALLRYDEQEHAWQPAKVFVRADPKSRPRRSGASHVAAVRFSP